MNPLTVVIPIRQGNSPDVTLHSLAHQSYKTFDIVLSHDDRGNANWARNQGFKLVKTPFVLFSDDDIDWAPDALENLMTALRLHPDKSYAYGTYTMEGRIYCDGQFDPERLRKLNYISTMSIIRSAEFLGFDEHIQRLQDWDLWLTMLEWNRWGVHCGRVIFKTFRRVGITASSISWEEAERTVKDKHKLV